MNLSEILETLKVSKDRFNLEELKNFHEAVSFQIHQLRSTDFSVLSMYETLNDLHDIMMSKAIQLAEKETLRSGIGKRPSQMCWVLFGSGGRKEQTIWTDQDNGILYQCPSNEKMACLLFIEKFARLGTHHLNYMGYPLCPGNVMATNKRWANDTESWLEALKHHVDRGAPDDIKYLFIASDLRGLYGDVELVQETKENLFQTLQASSFILKRMHEHIQEPKVSLGILGHILTERFGEQSGKFNIKMGAYVPLTNSLKYLALRHKITAFSSLERLEALSQKNIINKTESEIIKQALEICLYFRWLASFSNKEKDRNYIDLSTLPEQDYERLKASLKEIKAFQLNVIRKVDRYAPYK